MLSALLSVCVLSSPAWCGPSAAPAAGVSPRPRLATGEQQGDISVDQVMAQLTSFCEAAIREATAASQAAMAASLARVAKSLSGVQEELAAVSGRLDNMEDSQATLFSSFDSMQATQRALSSRFDAMQELQREVFAMQQSLKEVSDEMNSLREPQSALSSRMDSLLASQGVLPDRLDTLRDSQTDLSSRLDTLNQSRSVHASRLNALNEAQSALSGRVDTLLQWQSGAASEQLDAIRAAVGRIPRLVLGSPCLSDSDCSQVVPEAVCGEDRRCSCPASLRRISDTVCGQHSRLGEPCFVNGHCQVQTANAMCTGGVCGCAAGFWNSNNTECRPLAAEGDSCSDDRQCASDFVCVSGECSCPVISRRQFQYRLAKGTSCDRGRVELRRTGGSWGFVCQDGWDIRDTSVICRTLGFSEGAEYSRAQYDDGNNFYMDNVMCLGYESDLLQCRYDGWENHDCRSNKVIWVRCR